MDKRFYIFISLRVLSVIIVQTWFVPDETWQVTEVAHKWSFGYGYICWEWKEKIRSILYPGIFSVLYYILYLLKMDFVFLVTHIPRLLSSILFAVGDYYMYKVSAKLLGKASSDWVIVCLCTSWFLAYCAPRTLTSCAEMVLFSVALYHYPWNREKASSSTSYLTWGGLGCIIRPTLAVFLAPYCLHHLILSRRRSQILLRFCLTVIFILLVSIAVDSIFYGEVTVVPWNFLRFNILSGLSAHYGTHPWHWYLAQGLPATCGFHLIPLAWGVRKHFHKYKRIFMPCLWGIVIHSFLGHKEFRFLLPIIPLLLIIAGDSIFTYLRSLPQETRVTRKSLILCILIIPNAITFLYMGIVHQRGPIDVMTYLGTVVKSEPNASFLFLTPCHSTPLYSHLHVNIPVRFLTCEPNLQNLMNYRDEADDFYEHPMNWITKEFLNNTGPPSSILLPTHIIMFDSLASDIRPFLIEENYTLCQQIFNAHFYEGKRGKYFNIYCHHR